MKTLLLFLCVALFGCANGKYVGPPIQGKVCYTKNGTRYCVGSDGKVISLDVEAGFKK